MKKLLLITSLAIALCSHAEIPTVELKNASVAMQPGYESLSPAYGALYWYSPFIRNIYSYGPSSATKNLIRELFSILHDGITFDCTHDYTNTVRYLHPEHIGALLNILEKNTDTIASYNQLLAEQNKEMALLLNLEQATITPALLERQIQIKTGSNSTLALKIKTLQKKYTRQQEQLTSKILIPIKTALEQYIQEILVKPDQASAITNLFEQGRQATIARHKKQLENPATTQAEKNKIEKSINVLKSMQPPTKGATFSFLLIKGKLEEGSLYPEGTVKNILLAFAWKKAANRDDFKALYTGYAQQIGMPSTAVINNSTWQGAYSNQDYKDLTTKSPKSFSLDDFILIAKGYSLFESMLPEEVTMINEVHFKNHQFPDCGETSLRNFFDALTYTLEKSFDRTILEKLNADEKLIEFYKNYPDCTNIKTNIAHNDWAGVVSERENVAYSRDICEIDAKPTGPGNMQKLLGILIPGANSWDNLKTLLKEKCDIEFEFSFSESQLDNPATLTFSIEKKHNNKIYSTGNLTWSFWPHHFNLSLSVPSKIYNAYMSYLKTTKPYDTNALLGLFTHDPADLVTITGRQSQLDFFFINLENPEQKTKILRKISNPEIIKSIFQSLPNDQFIIEEACKSLSLKTGTEQFRFLDKTLHGQAQDNLYELIGNNIINARDEKMYDKIPMLIEKIKNKQKAINLIREILSIASIGLKPIPAIKAIEPLYVFAQNKIQQIQDPHETAVLILSLLSTRIAKEEIGKLFEPMYTWATAAIEKIDNEEDIYQTTQSLLHKRIFSPYELNLVRPLYAQTALLMLKIKDEEKIVSLVKELLIKATDGQTANYLKPLYDSTATLLPKVEKNNYTIISTLINNLKNIKAKPETITLLEPFYTASIKLIQNIKDPHQLTDIIDELFTITPQLQIQALYTLLAPLYQAAADQIQIIFSDIARIQEIKTLLLEKKAEDKEEALLLKPFYEKIYGLPDSPFKLLFDAQMQAKIKELDKLIGSAQ